MAWDIRHARVFIAVAEQLHFGKAAQLLNTSQSAISRTIKWMEDDLRLQLLTRNTRYVELTPEGHLFLEECRKIVTQLDRSLRRSRAISSGLAGEIDVGCNDFALLAELPEIVNSFQRAFPDISIRLHDVHRSVQLQGLAKGTLDIGFILGPMELPDMDQLTTGRYPLKALVSSTHVLAQREKVSMTDLANERFIFGGRPVWDAYRSSIDAIFHAAHIVPNVTQEVNESIGIFGLVAAGVGISIYPDCRVGEQYRNCVVKKIEGVDSFVETTAVWYPRTLTRAANHFVEFLADFQAGAA